MSLYLCVKNSKNETKRYIGQTTASKPYLKIENDYFQLTTETSPIWGLRISKGTKVYRIHETYTTTIKTTTTNQYTTSKDTYSTYYSYSTFTVNDTRTEDLFYMTISSRNLNAPNYVLSRTFSTMTAMGASTGNAHASGSSLFMNSLVLYETDPGITSNAYNESYVKTEYLEGAAIISMANKWPLYKAIQLYENYYSQYQYPLNTSNSGFSSKYYYLKSTTISGNRSDFNYGYAILYKSEIDRASTTRITYTSSGGTSMLNSISFNTNYSNQDGVKQYISSIIGDGNKTKTYYFYNSINLSSGNEVVHTIGIYAGNNSTVKLTFNGDFPITKNIISTYNSTYMLSTALSRNKYTKTIKGKIGMINVPNINGILTKNLYYTAKAPYVTSKTITYDNYKTKTTSYYTIQTNSTSTIDVTNTITLEK